MGINTGAKILVNALKPGLYNHNAKQYNVYIDGELMRYKGLCDNTQANTSECVAQLAHDYMVRLVSDVERLLKRRALNIYVYMDGPKRVKNKTTTRAEQNMNADIIRATFKEICNNTGYSIIEMDCGEAELVMYLQRDQTIDLNVFITCDSDMASICYGHKPKMYYLDEPNKQLPDNKYSYARLPNNQFVRNSNGDIVVDGNCDYCPNADNRRYRVVDSCLWMNCLKTVECIGCDFIAERLNITPRVFRTLVCMCGTDYSNNILTVTMIKGIMNVSKEGLTDINCLETTRQIICSLLYYGLKYNGTVKRQPKNTENFAPTNLVVYEQNVEDYIKYIATGEMTNDEIKNMNMFAVCQKYLTMMRMMECHKKRSFLKAWCGTYSMLDVIRFVDSYDSEDDFMHIRRRRTKNNRNNIKNIRRRKSKKASANTTPTKTITSTDFTTNDNRHIVSMDITDDGEVTAEVVVTNPDAELLKQLETIYVGDSENEDETTSNTSTQFNSEDEMFRCMIHLTEPEPEPDFFH